MEGTRICNNQDKAEQQKLFNVKIFYRHSFRYISSIYDQWLYQAI